MANERHQVQRHECAKRSHLNYCFLANEKQNIQIPIAPLHRQTETDAIFHCEIAVATRKKKQTPRKIIN